MAEYADGFQIGPDGKRHALADLGSVRESSRKAATIRVFGDPVQGAVPAWNAVTERCEWSGSGSAITFVASSTHTDDGESEAFVIPGSTLRLDLVVTALVGTNEVQTVTLANATGGTFTLTFNGQTTSALAYDAPASAVQTALRALSNIGDSDVSVSGSAGGPYTVTFTGALGSQNVATMSASGGSLTGSSPTVNVATQTAGVEPDLTVTVESTVDPDSGWSNVGDFAPRATTGSEHKIFEPVDEYARVSWVLGNGTTSATFAVTGEVV